MPSGVAGETSRPSSGRSAPPSGLDGLRLPPGLPRTIVACIGQNENGVLRQASHDFMAILAPIGLTGQVIDLTDNEWPGQLGALLNEGVLFAWGQAGIGARLRSGQNYLWDEAKVPFISVLADSPSWMPANHRVASRYVANGYLYRDWFDIQRRLIKSPQISSLLVHGELPNPARDAIAWSKRSHRMVFVKTGHAPALHRSRWLALPRRFRAVIEDASSAALRAGVGDITDTVLQCLEHHKLHVEQRLDVLFALMQEVDVYVRDVRSTAMVTAMLDLPVEIIGRGWDHLTRLGGRAKFHPAIDAATLPALYADTQFLVNTMPNFSAGTHERVLSGFAAKCCVVTNENAHMRERFTSLPSYFPLNTEAPDLASPLAALYHDTRRYDDGLQPALDLFNSDYRADILMRGIIDLALEVIKAAEYAPFSLA